MKKKKNIFVVINLCGHYSNVDCAFTNYESAVKYCDELNDKMGVLYAEFLNCQDNAMYQIRTLTDAYIEKNYPDIWTKMNEENNSEDEDLWGTVSNIELDFEEDIDGLFEFAKERGLSDKDISDIETYYKYMDKEDQYGMLPTYVIRKNIELIEG